MQGLRRLKSKIMTIKVTIIIVKINHDMWKLNINKITGFSLIYFIYTLSPSHMSSVYEGPQPHVPLSQ